MKPRDIIILIGEHGEEIRVEGTTAGIEYVTSRQTIKIKDVRVETKVPQIKNGSVFDHIYPESGIDLLKELGLLDLRVAVLLNADSEKYGKKDLIKVENWYPDEYHIGKINNYILSLPVPRQRLTLSKIEKYEVKEKYRFEPEKGLKKLW